MQNHNDSEPKSVLSDSMGIAAKVFGYGEPKGYYEMQKTHFQMPTEVTSIGLKLSN